MSNSRVRKNQIAFPLVPKRPKRRRRRPKTDARQLDLFAHGKLIELPVEPSAMDMALLYDDCGDDRAEEWYIRAINDGDRPMDALCNLGSLYVRSSNTTEAFACFSEAIRRNPFHLEAHRNLGDYYVVAGDDVQALAHFRWGARIAPRDPTTRFCLGVILARQGRREEAIAELEVCRQLTRRPKRAAEELLRQLRQMVGLSEISG